MMMRFDTIVRLWVTRMVSLWVILFTTAFFAPNLLHADTITVTHNNSSITVDPSDDAGLYEWIVDGVNNMSQSWFWFRIGDAGPESPLNSLNLILAETPNPNQIHLQYGDPSSGDPLFVDVLYTLVGGDPGSGYSLIMTDWSITNNTSETIDLHWFVYTDLDLDDTADGDIAQFVSPNMIIQTEILPVFTWYYPNPTHWEIALFPDIIDKLTDDDADNLDDATSPLGPDDIAFAAQFYYRLDPGGTAMIQSRMQQTPEPSALFLLCSGLAGLGLRRWMGKRRSMKS